MNVPSGYTALDLIGFTDKGDYISTENYVKNDLVHYNGRVWLCLVDDTTAITPVAGANWKVWIDEAAYLSGLADVTISNPANGEAIRYNSQSRKWENVSVDSTPTSGSANLVQSGGVATQLANKANSADLATVATSGNYQDLNNLPSLADVATTGQYSDLLGTPTIPTVNNGTLTIQKNGTTVQTFDANDSSNKTANITVPTKTSDLTNDSNFVSDANYQHITVDSAFSDSSTNPVQNKVVNSLKETLTNEIVTRSTLGAHNLFDVGNSIDDWFLANNNGLTPKENMKGSDRVTATIVSSTNSVTVTAYNSSGYYWPCKRVELQKNTAYKFSYATASGNIQLFGKNNADVNATLIGGFSSGVLNSGNYDYWYIGFYPTVSGGYFSITNFLVRLASDADDTYRPYVPTNSQLLSYKDNGVLGAKNLLPRNVDGTLVRGGVTFTANDDGTITLTNTSTAVAWYTVGRVSLSAGTYRLSGCPAGGSADNTDNTYRLAANLVNDIGNGAIFTLTSTQTVEVTMRIGNSTNTNGLVFKPMIRLASDTDPTYQPYAMTNRQLTEEIDPLIAAVGTFKAVRGSNISANSTRKITTTERAVVLIVTGRGTATSAGFNGLFMASMGPTSVPSVSAIQSDFVTATGTANGEITVTNNATASANLNVIVLYGDISIT